MGSGHPHRGPRVRFLGAASPELAGSMTGCAGVFWPRNGRMPGGLLVRRPACPSVRLCAGPHANRRGHSPRPHAAGRPRAKRAWAVRSRADMRRRGVGSRSVRPRGPRTTASSGPGPSLWPDCTVLRLPHDRGLRARRLRLFGRAGGRLTAVAGCADARGADYAVVCTKSGLESEVCPFLLETER